MKQLLALPGCSIDRIRITGTVAVVHAHPKDRAAPCPSCDVRSSRTHSYRTRVLADLPAGSRRVQLHMRLRRLYCCNVLCPRRTFTHPLAMADRYARRTCRLDRVLLAIATALGGEAGHRLLTELRMPASADTLLRRIRRQLLPGYSNPRVIGVDDWAFRKGVTYGTILVDLETRSVLDLLPDRQSHTLAAWLRDHPSIEIVARDRSTDYTAAVTSVLPDAVQVADRWHLLANTRDMLERYLLSVHRQLRRLPPLPEERKGVARTRAFPRGTTDRARRDAHREKRLARYHQVKERLAAGHSHSRIARDLKINRQTVIKYARAQSFPERALHPVRPSILDPFLPYLVNRHEEGCENASRLWREIREQGFTGKKNRVLKWMQTRRREPAKNTPTKFKLSSQEQNDAKGVPLVSPKMLARLVVRPAASLSSEEQGMLARIEQDERTKVVLGAAREFVRMIREQDPSPFRDWLESCIASGIRQLQAFGVSLSRDQDAVQAALSLSWSNAQAEGQITKLKAIKRAMYGRARFDLLRQRVLLA